MPGSWRHSVPVPTAPGLPPQGPFPEGASFVLAGMAAGQVMMGAAGPVQVKDSPLLLRQIDALQLSVKHLKNENNRLQGAQMRRALASLSPLHVPKLCLPKDRQGDEMVSSSLHRKASRLLETLYQMSANATVVDITRQRTAASPAAQLLEQTARLKSLSEAVDKLEDEVLKETVLQHPGANVPSAFGTFPSAPFLKAKEEQKSDTVYVGKVTFPCQPGHGQVHRLVLTPEQLHKVHARLIS